MQRSATLFSYIDRKLPMDVHAKQRLSAPLEKTKRLPQYTLTEILTDFKLFGLHKIGMPQYANGQETFSKHRCLCMVSGNFPLPLQPHPTRFAKVFPAHRQCL